MAILGLPALLLLVFDVVAALAMVETVGWLPAALVAALTVGGLASAYVYGVRVGVRATKLRAYEAGKQDAYAEVMI